MDCSSNTYFYTEIDVPRTAPLLPKREIVALFRHGHAQLLVERTKVWPQDTALVEAAAASEASWPTLSSIGEGGTSEDQSYVVAALDQARLAEGYSLNDAVQIVAGTLNIGQEEVIALLRHQSQYLGNNEETAGGEVDHQDAVTMVDQSLIGRARSLITGRWQLCAPLHLQPSHPPVYSALAPHILFCDRG